MTAYASWCRHCYYMYYFQKVHRHDYWLFAQEFKVTVYGRGL